MSDKMRDEFHEWCRSIGFTIKMNEWGNDYAFGHGWEQWHAWKASRAALVVELPAQWSNQCYDDEIMFSGQVIDAIDSAGVSYK